MHSSPVISIQLAGQPAMLASKQEFVPLLRDRPVTVISWRQMLSWSTLIAWFCLHTHRNDRSNATRESMQKVFRAHAVFIMPEYQCVLLDRRSLEGKKRGKKEQIFLQSTFGSQCGKNKHSRSLRDTICKKMKIPKGTDNVVSALKTDGVGAHHLFEQIQCSIMNQREKPTAQLLCCLKGEWNLVWLSCTKTTK